VPKRLDRRTWMTQAGLAAGAGLGSISPAEAAPGPGRLRLGLVTYNVAKDWDLETILKNVREAGLEAVEFRTTHAHGVEPSLAATRRREVRERCQDAGLLQTSLGTTCEFHSPDPAVVEQNVETCREFVRLVQDIGARGVKVRPNGLPEGVPVEKTLAQIGKALAECGRIGADAGVETWMEVHGKETQEPARNELWSSYPYRRSR
jgi:sugar phosphate isomerase/epimerase